MNIAKTNKTIASQLWWVFLALPCSVYADIYIDTSLLDEIVVSNVADYTSQKSISIIKENTSHNESILLINNHKSNLPYHSYVLIAAKQTALAPALIHAIISAESRHNPKATSHKGAVGLMQLMPETAARFNVIDRKNPRQNILAGSKYLRELLDMFNGDLKLTLAAYNAGPGAVIKYHHQIPPYQETQRYVPKVLKYYRQYT